MEVIYERKSRVSRDVSKDIYQVNQYKTTFIIQQTISISLLFASTSTVL